MKIFSQPSSRTISQIAKLSITCSLAACTSLDRISTDTQRTEIKTTEYVLVENKDQIRTSVDTSGDIGALIFTDNKSGTLAATLPGRSPMDAWIRYVSGKYKGPMSELPLPSSISKTAAFVYADPHIARNELVLSANFDEDVRKYYDLARTMTRLGSDIQDLRDMTVLLSRSEKQQRSAIVKLSTSFDQINIRLSSLREKLEKLEIQQSQNQSDTLDELDVIAKDISQIKTLLEKL